MSEFMNQYYNEKAAESWKNVLNSYPTQNGLRVPDILLLAYCTKGNYPNPMGGYPQFWYYDYGISDVNIFLDNLARRGFLRYQTIDEMLETAKASKLKQILSDAGLSASGVKRTLVQRIKENCDEHFLSEYMVPKYHPTETGERELQYNYYVAYLHEHHSAFISVWDLNKVVHDNPGMSWGDILWGEFNRKIISLGEDALNSYRRTKEKMFLYEGKRREANIKCEMGEYLIYEKRYAVAVECFLRSCFIMINDTNDRYVNDDPVSLLMPYILNPLRKAMKNAEMSYDDVRSLAINAFRGSNPINRRLSDEATANCIIRAIKTQ